MQASLLFYAYFSEPSSTITPLAPSPRIILSKPSRQFSSGSIEVTIFSGTTVPAASSSSDLTQEEGFWLREPT